MTLERTVSDNPAACLLPCDEPLRRLAIAAARHVRADAPAVALHELGLELRAHSEPLQLPNKRVFGSWDPVLRRIEVFGCNPTRTDEELVHSLGHEFGHALLGPHHCEEAEAEATRFAELWLDQLGPQRVCTLASALRRLADQPPSKP